WVTSPDNQAAFAHLTSIFPSTKASAGDPFFSKSDGTNGGDAKVTAFASLPEAKMLQPVEVGEAISKVVKQQFSLAISGGTTSKQALDTAVAKADELLQQ
ncbi:sugar ABC transporter substrate-binding protein, partial [Nonomuraea sp. NPDC055795]